MVFQINSNKPVEIATPTSKFKLKPNTPYYFGGWGVLKQIFDTNGIKYSMLGELEDLIPDKVFTKRKNNNDMIFNGSKILITRSGGAGDMLFFSPFIKWLHDHGCEVRLACKEQYREVLSGQPFMAAVYRLPIEYRIIKQQNGWISARGVIEAFKYNVYDMLVTHLRIPLKDEEKRPVFIPLDENEKMADQFFEKYVEKSKKVIAVQLNATANTRTWPYSIPLASLLKSHGYKVILLGSYNQITTLSQMSNMNGYLFPQLVKNDYAFSASIVKRCDLLVGPDSAMYHFAEAVGTKALVFFGPFKPENRIKYYKHVWTLSPEEKYCVHCQSHEGFCKRSNIFTNFSPCLEQISPQIAFESILHILNL